MKLIKKLNEDARTSMDSHTFDRLVKLAKADIKNTVGLDASDSEMLDIIYHMIEDIAGYEMTKDADELAGRVLRMIKNK